MAGDERIVQVPGEAPSERVARILDLVRYQIPPRGSDAGALFGTIVLSPKGIRPIILGSE